MSSAWDMASGEQATGTFADIDWAATDNDDIFNPSGATAQGNDFLAVDPRAVKRAETAPMVLTILSSDGTLCVSNLVDEVEPGEEYRYTEEYHRLYYSKTPRDPRMLPPLTRRRAPVATNRDGLPSGEGGAVGAVGTVAPTTGAVGDKVESSEEEDHAAAAAAATATKQPLDSVTEAVGSAANSHANYGSLTQQIADADAVPADAAQSGSNSCDDNAPLDPVKKLQQYIDAFRPEWDYVQVRGCVNTFSRDQDGSRLIQRLLERRDHVVDIFEEIMPEFEELTTDVFGNYVLQKLFEIVPKVEREMESLPEVQEAHMLERLTAKVRGNLKRLSKHMYGCRVMQKAIEFVKPADRDALAHEIEGQVPECVFDQNANHVVQKIVEVSPEKCQFIIDEFMGPLSELACNAYGCRVLQRTFEKCHDVEGVDLRPLLEAVASRISEFTIHQYGNYVVQHGMLNAPEDLRRRFVKQLTPQVYALSCSKFASNVAEKVVSTCAVEERDAIITQLTNPFGDSQGGNYLVHMMQDTYANYVVQRLLEASNPEQRTRIGELIMPYVTTVNQSVYGRHLLRKIEGMGIITSEFLRQRGVDVTTPEYTGVIMGPGGVPMAAGGVSPNFGGNGRNSRKNGGRGGAAGSGSGSRRGSVQALGHVVVAGGVSTPQPVPPPPQYMSATAPGAHPHQSYMNMAASSPSGNPAMAGLFAAAPPRFTATSGMFTSPTQPTYPGQSMYQPASGSSSQLPSQVPSRPTSAQFFLDGAYTFQPPPPPPPPTAGQMGVSGAGPAPAYYNGGNMNFYPSAGPMRGGNMSNGGMMPQMQSGYMQSPNAMYANGGEQAMAMQQQQQQAYSGMQYNPPPQQLPSAPAVTKASHSHNGTRHGRSDRRAPRAPAVQPATSS